MSQAGSGILRPILSLRPSSTLQCLQTRSSWQVATVTSLMPAARLRFRSRSHRLSLSASFIRPFLRSSRVVRPSSCPAGVELPGPRRSCPPPVTFSFSELPCVSPWSSTAWRVSPPSPPGRPRIVSTPQARQRLRPSSAPALRVTHLARYGSEARRTERCPSRPISATRRHVYSGSSTVHSKVTAGSLRLRGVLRSTSHGRTF